MSPSRTLPQVVFAVVVAITGLAACRSERHVVVEPAPGTKVICQQCYDELAKFRRRAGHRGPSYTKNVIVHQCSQCDTEMFIYSENGVLMVRCDGCVPEGVACDKCVPPRER